MTEKQMFMMCETMCCRMSVSRVRDVAGAFGLSFVRPDQQRCC